MDGRVTLGALGVLYGRLGGDWRFGAWEVFQGPSRSRQVRSSSGNAKSWVRKGRQALENNKVRIKQI